MGQHQGCLWGRSESAVEIVPPVAGEEVTQSSVCALRAPSPPPLCHVCQATLDGRGAVLGAVFAHRQ